MLHKYDRKIWDIQNIQLLMTFRNQTYNKEKRGILKYKKKKIILDRQIYLFSRPHTFWKVNLTIHNCFPKKKKINIEVPERNYEEDTDLGFPNIEFFHTLKTHYTPQVSKTSWVQRWCSLALPILKLGNHNSLSVGLISQGQKTFVEITETNNINKFDLHHSAFGEKQ